MRYSLLIIIFSFLYFSLGAQKPESGTYTFEFCDLEYHMCMGPCKVVIKGDSITIYASKELEQKLTFIKEGDIMEQGLILKHKTGVWIIAKTIKDAETDQIGFDGPARLDLRKKQCWRY